MDIAVYKSSLLALSISIICTPLLLRFSRRKGLFASINHRSSHDASVPNTGGIILGFAVLLPLILFSDYPNQKEFSLLISAFAVLLITGIIDDFNPIPVAYKFLGQFIPAIVIVTSIDEQDLVIPFINEFIQLPFFFKYLFWIVFIVMSINAFNLIDGIDGLAIGLGIIGGVFYFLQFYRWEVLDLMIFSTALSFGLLGLFFFNISKKFKIFIGDTGSLLIGGLLVFFALRFVSLPESESISGSFFMVIGSVFIPLADLIRLTLVRIVRKESPFKADRQHIHHLLLDLLKGSHMLTTNILLISQLGVIVLFQYLADQKSIYLISILVLSFALYFGAAHILTYARGKLKKT